MDREGAPRPLVYRRLYRRPLGGGTSAVKASATSNVVMPMVTTPAGVILALP